MCETPKIAKKIQQSEQILRILNTDYFGELNTVYVKYKIYILNLIPCLVINWPSRNADKVATTTGHRVDTSFYRRRNYDLEVLN